jgi:hypothetical protein
MYRTLGCNRIGRCWTGGRLDVLDVGRRQLDNTYCGAEMAAIPVHVTGMANPIAPRLPAERMASLRAAIRLERCRYQLPYPIRSQRLLPRSRVDGRVSLLAKLDWTVMGPEQAPAPKNSVEI